MKLTRVSQSASVFVVVWVYFFVPELKGRNLEEIDYMYDNGVSARLMSTYVIDKEALPGSSTVPALDIDEKGAGKETVGHFEALEKV